MDEVNELTVKPFRDVVYEANTALENAGENDVMRKAAKKLLREGEKAVKLIEPQCAKRHSEYGDNFLNALRESGKKYNCPARWPPSPSFSLAIVVFSILIHSRRDQGASHKA